jgi:hypothetical protein
MGWRTIASVIVLYTLHDTFDTPKLECQKFHEAPPPMFGRCHCDRSDWGVERGHSPGTLHGGVCTDGTTEQTRNQTEKNGADKVNSDSTESEVSINIYTVRTIGDQYLSVVYSQTVEVFSPKLHNIYLYPDFHLVQCLMQRI